MHKDICTRVISNYDRQCLSNNPHKKESANGNARWTVHFFIVTTSDLIGPDSKTAKTFRFKVHFV